MTYGRGGIPYYATCLRCAHAMRWEEHRQLRKLTACPECGAAGQFGRGAFAPGFIGFTAEEAEVQRRAALRVPGAPSLTYEQRIRNRLADWPRRSKEDAREDCAEIGAEADRGITYLIHENASLYRRLVRELERQHRLDNEPPRTPRETAFDTLPDDYEAPH